MYKLNIKGDPKTIKGGHPYSDTWYNYMDWLDIVDPDGPRNSIRIFLKDHFNGSRDGVNIIFDTEEDAMVFILKFS